MRVVIVAIQQKATIGATVTCQTKDFMVACGYSNALPLASRGAYFQLATNSDHVKDAGNEDVGNEDVSGRSR